MSFARETQDLLNKTTCTGARVVPLLDPYDDNFVRVGTNLDRTNLDPRPVPLVVDRGKPRAWLSLSYQLYLNPNGHLTVLRSFYGVSVDAAGEEMLFHYDYEREKRDDYPEAHLQVYGSNKALDAVMEVISEHRPMEKLHFPVGGRRYRPTVEDLIEFLVREGLAEVRGEREQMVRLINARRTEFQLIQLRAAIRQNPDVAVAVLEDLGYRLSQKPAPQM